MSYQGTVKFFNREKGFGFITPGGGGEDVFVHWTNIQKEGFKSLNEGETVDYELQYDEQKQKAAAISVIGHGDGQQPPKGNKGKDGWGKGKDGGKFGKGGGKGFGGDKGYHGSDWGKGGGGYDDGGWGSKGGFGDNGWGGGKGGFGGGAGGLGGRTTSPGQLQPEQSQE